MRSIAIIGMLFLALTMSATEAVPLTPQELVTALAAKPRGDDASRLAEQIRETIGAQNLTGGRGVRVDGLNVVWAIEVADAPRAPEVVSEDGKVRIRLKRLGKTPVYTALASFPDGTAFRWRYEVAGERRGGGQVETYAVHPDSLPQTGVPRGSLRQMPPWESKVFAGTRRDWWIYIPAQYRPETPACVMVFQDGAGPRNYVPTVFDNLIAKGEIPVAVGVFLQPGTRSDGRSNRSFEYDTLSDQYARFLLEEILPEVEKLINLRQDAAGRAIAGISSGGICAFTVAWERPDAFSKVLSWVGSFTNIASGASRREGGHNYPALIRKTPRKPIRVFLQDGENDLDNIHGNWPLANHQMARALAFAGYDYKFVMGNGFHSDRHGRAILPDSLRWLWRPEGASSDRQAATGGR
jgi:enterochelin esterase family protein